MHLVVPIFQKETSEVLKASVRDQWIAWAGPPEHLTVDPAKTNLGGPFVEFCENAGICFHQTAADAHWQFGKVERHGQWFARIFDRVCDEIRPTNQQEFVDCLIQTQTAKNSLLSQRGVSPYQLVFGRNLGSQKTFGRRIHMSQLRMQSSVPNHLASLMKFVKLHAEQFWLVKMTRH